MFKRVTNLIFLTWNNCIFWGQLNILNKNILPRNCNIDSYILPSETPKYTQIRVLKMANYEEAASSILRLSFSLCTTGHIHNVPVSLHDNFQSLTDVTVLIHSHEHNYYAIASPSLWSPKHTDLRAHDFAHSPDWWHQPWLANITGAWNLRHFGINPAIPG
jgi:hypothetical protein